MTQKPGANPASPDYWGGFDIENPAISTAEQPPEPPYLASREYQLATRMLARGITAMIIGAGQVNEVRYGVGAEFGNEALPDGSLVAIESESLEKHVYDVPKAPWSRSYTVGDPDLCRPYSQYWLERQQERGAARSSTGWRSITFPEQHMRYDLSVKWGVIITSRHAKGRVIQPFNFNSTDLHENGTVGVPSYDRRNQALTGPAIPLPLNVGETVYIAGTPSPTTPGSRIDRLERISAVDIVHVAPLDKRRPRRRRIMSRLAPPVLAPIPSL